MDILEKLKLLRDERNWSNYKLAQMSGVSHATIRNMFKRNTLPGVINLEALCKGFGISLSLFFAGDGDLVQLNDEQLKMLKLWEGLAPEHKEALTTLMKKLAE